MFDSKYLLLVFVALLGLVATGCDDSDSAATMGGMMGGGASSITINVTAGNTPAYTWAGGDVFSISVVRVSNPTVIVWGLVTPGADGISSNVTHGNVPVGMTQTALPGDLEATLTPGVAYRVTVSRLDTTFGFTDFTP